MKNKLKKYNEKVRQDKWRSINSPPKYSCKVVILFEEFGVFGHRHFCTGYYGHLDNVWTPDSKEYIDMTPSHYKDVKLLKVPGPIPE